VTYEWKPGEFMRLWYCRGILELSMLLRLAVGLGVPSLLFLHDYPRLACIASAYLMYLPVALYFQIRRLARKNPALQQPTRLTYSPLKLKLEANGSIHQTEWQNFESWSQTRAYFFLVYCDNRLDLVIPKRAFNSIQLADFSQLLKLSLP